MKTSDKIDLIAAALVKLQAEIEPAIKDSENPHFKSHFASLDSIWSVAAPVLTKNNIAVFQGGDLDGSIPVLVTRLIHSSGQWIEGRFPLLSMKPNDPQAQGSSITYAKRYGLAAALGITTIDDDGNAAASAPPPAAKREGPRPPSAVKPLTKPKVMPGFQSFGEM
jgi:hypothetical protein